MEIDVMEHKISIKHYERDKKFFFNVHLQRRKNVNLFTKRTETHTSILIK